MRGRMLIICAMLATTAAELSAQPICQEQRITPGDPGAFKSFGVDVALSGNTAVVGAAWDFPGGASYIFELSDGSWIQSVKLKAPDGEAGDLFGEMVAVENNVLAVAARGHWHDGPPERGAVYVWRKVDGEWVFEQEILPPKEVNQFGMRVILNNERLLISRTQAVYLYSFSGTSWSLEHTFPDPVGEGFGHAVGLDGNLLVVGAGFDDSVCDQFETDCGGEKCGNTGLVYVYRFNGQDWVLEQTLAASDPQCERQFGRAVAVSGDTILAAATNPPATYVFEYDHALTQWKQTTIIPAGTTLNQWHYLALQGDLAMISDPAPSGDATAEVRAFQRLADGKWILRAVLKPEPNPWGSFFGWAVSIHGDRAIIGAHGEDQQSGAAYIYDLNPKVGDLTCDGVVGVPDLLELLAAWGPCPPPGSGTTGCPGDLNADGVVGVPDLLLLLANWG